MTDLNLPWTGDALNQLLVQVVGAGEGAKVDLKQQFSISSADQIAEFLKDVSALANTFDRRYDNHGFLVFGAAANNLTYCTFDKDSDHLQGTIDDLIRTNIGPFIPTQLRIFSDKNGSWGTLIIPPTQTAPHVFVRDIHKRHRGEIYVRRGTITDKADPTDYARFFRLHLDEHTYELRRQISDLRHEIAAVKAATPVVQPSPPTSEPFAAIGPTTANPPSDLATTIRSRFPNSVDSVRIELLTAVKRIVEFINGTAVPWALQATDKAAAEGIVEKLEMACDEFWRGLGLLIELDDKSMYDDAIALAIQYLARDYFPGPGIPYNSPGQSIRFYPLVVALYIIFVIGASKSRIALMKKIKNLQISRRWESRTPWPILSTLTYVRGAQPAFRALHPDFPKLAWTDGVGMTIKSYFERAFPAMDMFSEPDEQFFVGEFLLCTSSLDVPDTNAVLRSSRRVSFGSFLISSGANLAIRQFLDQKKNFMEELFDRPLHEILAEFDTAAPQLAYSSGGFGGGFTGGASEIVFPK